MRLFLQKMCLVALVLSILSRDQVETKGQDRAGQNTTAPSLSELIKDLKSPQLQVRYRAIDAIGELGADAREAVEPLIEALKDENVGMRNRAAFALGKIGPSAKDALDALGALLSDDDPAVCGNALVALSRIDSQAQVGPISEVLTNKWPHLRLRAVQALGKMGPKAKAASPALARALKDGDKQVRDAAFEALRIIDPDATCAALIEGLNAKDASARRDAALTLGTVGPRTTGAGGKTVVESLCGVLKDHNAGVRHAAIQSLGKMGREAKAASPALAGAMKDGNKQVRDAAFEALRIIDPDATCAALIEGLTAKDASARRDAAQILGTVGPRTTGPGGKTVVESLCGLLKDDNAGVRHAAIESLGRMGPKAAPAVPQLVGILETDAAARRDSAEALGKIGPEAKAAAPALAGAMKDRDRQVRDAAFEALGYVDPEAACAALIDALKAKDASARRDAAHTLGTVGPRTTGAGAKTVVESLCSALKDDNAGVRHAGIESLGKMGPKAVSAVPQLVVILETEAGAWHVAAEALGRIGPEANAAVPALAHALKGGGKDVRGTAHIAISEIDPDAAPRDMVVAIKQTRIVEKLLHSGDLEKGGHALEDALAAAPRSDHLRFGLGVLQFVHSVERLGQSLHRYGAKSDTIDIPILRLPVPKNEFPKAISYGAFRRMLDEFCQDLSIAEKTLEGVTDDEVYLPLRLAPIRLDLVGDGRSAEKLMDILKRLFRRRQFANLANNPEFLVCFDRGDVAWLRAYCHLLMGMIDGYLAFDTEELFDLSADELFAKPEKRFRANQKDKQKTRNEAWQEMVVKEPARLGAFRKHLVKVAQLNREIWKYIRAEIDDDHEWLPNPKQTGVLGMPVRAEMIDAWLDAMAEMEDLLEGKKVALFPFGGKGDGSGLNVKSLLDDPPGKLKLEDLWTGELPDKYWSKEKPVDFNNLFRVWSVFGGDTTAFAYAAWFN
jgi:HEAT repeat protein